MTVNRPDGDKVLTNQVTSAETGNNCPAGGTDPRCVTTVAVAMLTITHTATPAMTIPTGVVRYTITIANAGSVAYTGLAVEQNFAGVLDDAASQRRGRPGEPQGSVQVAGSVLIWTGDVPAGETAYGAADVHRQQSRPPAT